MEAPGSSRVCRFGKAFRRVGFCVYSYVIVSERVILHDAIGGEEGGNATRGIDK